MKDVFKVGDRVFCVGMGWGKVEEIDYMERDGFPVLVEFDNWGDEAFTIDGKGNPNCQKILSFTHYTLDGFSQERPEELPKKGDVVWVRGAFPSDWQIGHFFDKEGENYRVSINSNKDGWTHCGIEMTTINPNK